MATYRTSGSWGTDWIRRREDLAVRVALVIDALGSLDTHICDKTHVCYRFACGIHNTELNVSYQEVHTLSQCPRQGTNYLQQDSLSSFWPGLHCR